MDHSELWKENSHVASFNHIEEYEGCYVIIFKKEGEVPQREIILKDPIQPERSKREDHPKLMRYTTPAPHLRQCMGEYKKMDECGALNSMET